jgi:sn1-specific diacylglycerol lipase
MAFDIITITITITMIINITTGAGAAVLLAMLLKPRYPTVHCYGYGTPACVLDRQTCIEVRSFVTSVVLGNDLICRLSLGAISHLRNKVLDAICRAKVNKMLILTACCREFNEEDVLYSEEESPNSAFKEAVENFKV